VTDVALHTPRIDRWILFAADSDRTLEVFGRQRRRSAKDEPLHGRSPTDPRLFGHFLGIFAVHFTQKSGEQGISAQLRPRRPRKAEGARTVQFLVAPERYLTAFVAAAYERHLKSLLLHGSFLRSARPEREARSWARDEEKKVERGESVRPTTLTLSAWVEDWLTKRLDRRR
jgi:hypothetical protein